MKGLMDKVLPPYDPMSAGHVLPVQLLIPEINELAGWRINEDHIKVTLYTYSIDHGNNMKFIASYSPDQVPGDYEPVDLSILHYMSLEVHEWFLENDAWKKSSVNKILVE